MSVSRFALPLSILLLLALTGSGAAAATDDDPATRGAAAFAAGDWQAAAEAYTQVVAGAPENGQAWLRLGQARIGLGKYDAALEALAKARELGVAPAALETARAYGGKGDKTQALSWLGKVADSGAKPYSRLMTLTELASLHDDPKFLAVAERLKPCGDPHYRDFDFWLGHWDVSNPQSPPGAENRITSAHDGCVVLEDYVNGNFNGRSVNWYDPAKKTWNQTWHDNQATILHLSGKLVDGSMVLSSDPEQTPINRVTWTPNADGSVRQHWQTSSDGGKTWTTAFDGLYTRKK